jgi:Uma2 family endonuclease
VATVSAQPVPSPPTHGWVPDPVRQKAADYTVDDVLTLPEDAPRVELLDGVMLVVPSPAIGHQTIARRLCNWLEANAPSEYRAEIAVGIRLDVKNSREPDVLLLRRPLRDSHYFTPDQVVIAAEVVSPGTRKRDRFEKPGMYADAGIPYYWRVEQDPVHVYAYGLRDGAYKLLADSDTVLKVDEPFPINLPVQAITP